MTESIEEIERKLGEAVEMERPWQTESDRIASIGFLVIILLGGPLQVYFAPTWFSRVTSFLVLVGVGYPFAMSTLTRRDYFTYPFRRPLVAREILADWELMEARGYPASAEAGATKAPVKE
jgi:hypothetical protein